MKKQLLSEEFTRMQKLAGILNETTKDELEDLINDYIEQINQKQSKEDLQAWWEQEGKKMGYDRDQIEDFWKNALEIAFVKNKETSSYYGWYYGSSSLEEIKKALTDIVVNELLPDHKGLF